MSVKVMSWVWENSPNQGGELLVLLGMADHANDAGERIFPSVESLGKKARLSRRQVQRILRKLEETGQIKQLGHHIPRGRPDRATIEYGIEMTILRPAENGVTSMTERGDISDQKEASGATCMSPDPSLREPSREPPQDDGISVQELLESWNEIVPSLGLATVRELSATRKQKAAHRIREHPKVDFWNDVFRQLKRSPFLLGMGARNGHEPWRANFDWLIENDTNCIKVAEGRYVQSKTR